MILFLCYIEMVGGWVLGVMLVGMLFCVILLCVVVMFYVFDWMELCDYLFVVVVVNDFVVFDCYIVLNMVY